jgi:hypothetical protein
MLKAEHLKKALSNLWDDEEAEEPEKGGLTARQVLYFGASSAFAFSLLRNVIIPPALGLVPQLKNLSTDKQNKWASYINSFIHALAQSVWATYRMGTTRPWSLRVSDSPRDSRAVVMFTVGYLTEDALSTLSEWSTSPDWAIHHILGIGLCMPTIWVPKMTRFVHLWGLVEWSTVFLDLMWFARELGGEKSRAFKLSALSFALSYFFWRCIWMPGSWITLHFKYWPVVRSLGAGRLFFDLILLLQGWWAVAIFKNLRKKL